MERGSVAFRTLRVEAKSGSSDRPETYQAFKLANYVENIEIKESADGFFSFAYTGEPSLTFEGYSLLESLRTDNFIGKLKKYAKEKGVPLTIENVIELAKIALPALIKMD